MIKAIKSINLFYKLLLAISISLFIILTIVFKSGILSLILTSCGISGAVMNTKGIKICYPLYLIQVFLYGIVALNSRFYGEAAINLLYATPMYIYSIIFWRNKAQNKVITDIYSLKLNAVLIISGAAVIFIPVMGYILSLLSSSLPYLNAASAFVYIVAILLATKRYLEQWIFWNLYSAISAVIWVSTFNGGLENLIIVCSIAVFMIINTSALISWIKLKRYLDEKTDIL